ncbi:AraC family transcriptional regulator [Microbacterium invictum]|uniref:AraC-like DNA-binding protein n=1 Tax=Microbacterium invictum TaxID=515415 RepID=A0AA40SQ32_9MICO|nr:MULTISPECIES: AraC family transcriptional regulator [Microbacterium]MBB4140271.1 AraC-like DNA-binding protein [Microbacterium invictum]
MTLTAERPATVENRSIDELRIVHIPGGSTYRVDATESDRWPYLALFARTGPAQVRGRLQLDLGDGDFTVLGNSAPVEIRALEDASVLAILVPAASLGPQAGRMKDADATVWSTSDGTASIVAHLLNGLASQSREYVPTNPGQLAHHVVGMMALLCSDAGATADPHGRGRLMQLAKDFIEEHLADLDLGPDVVAAHANVSTRTLHRMFEAEGITVRGWVRSRRLEHCRIELADLAALHIPVSAVGSRWGLWDAAHFSRLFKSTYGASPRAYRARAVAERDESVAAGQRARSA